MYACICVYTKTLLSFADYPREHDMVAVLSWPASNYSLQNHSILRNWINDYAGNGDSMQQFRSASGLQDKSDEKQISTVLYCLGDGAEDTLLSTCISEEERKKYTDILSKFNAFLLVRKNVTFD